ncbi:glycosyltransferase [Paenibacillus sinopodophylli]|uniref:GAP1-N2 domain-containing protein n=1 Tax=Paenibacillus sinopodophylli TaxID=1837342 RepID=UPI00110CBC89|nr:glycosyltransferase [Paenibacillus sinopodophylli]
MRDSTPSSKIQQQMYARERRGIFRSTEGYDTIAKSSGLDPAFIKKTLHPLCVYDAPVELAVRGEKDAALYPETMHLLHLDNGDVLLGRSIYQLADFTGLRSAFFTHNYLIPSSSKDAKAYTSWLHAVFEGGYDIEKGMELPELESLPVETVPAIRPSNRSVLSLLNIVEKPFKQLLYAVLSAISGKKKVYVALDVSIVELPHKAKQLLGVLYASLPYAFRQQLGFITYAKEPQSRKSVHLTFVEQGSLRLGDRSIEKEFTFDLASGRIQNAELEGTDQPYLDFVWDRLDRQDSLDSFFLFAEQMLEGMGQERRTAAASYHELSVMYQIEEGNEPLYEKHKRAVLRGLLEYMQPTGALDSKIRLNDLFLSRFDYEFDHVRQGIVPDAFLIDLFRDYYLIAGPDIERKLILFYIHALQEAIKQNKLETVEAIYAAVESEPALSKALFSNLMSVPKLASLLFIPFLKRKLDAAPGVRSLLELIERWSSVHPALLGYEPFHTLACEQLTAKLERERFSVLAVSKALEQLQKLKEEARLHGSRTRTVYAGEDMYEELELVAYRGMLTELLLDDLTTNELGQAQFLNHKDQLKRWDRRVQDPRQQSAASVLQAVYDWLMLPEPTDEVFKLLTPAEIDRAQQAGKQLMAARSEFAEAPRIVLAFQSSADLEQLDYSGLLDYLQRHAPNKEWLYRFFQWSEKQPTFMKYKGFVPAYAAAIVSYFKNHDRTAFKKRATRKQLFEKAGSSLTTVYKQAERELASPLAKLFRKNRKGTLMVSVALLGIVLVTAGIMLTFKDKAELLPEIQPTADVKVDQPDTIVYAENSNAAEGKEATTSLVFRFKDAAACAVFAPTSLTIEAPSSTADFYMDLSLTSNCGDPANDIAPTDNQAATDGLEGYDSQAVIDLGKQVEIPVDSVVKIAEVEYTVVMLQPE